MNEILLDAYVILNLKPTCSEEELKKRYRSLCLQYHPDKYRGDSTQFIKIKDAYNKIHNSKFDGTSTPNETTYENLQHIYMYMMFFGLSFMSEKNIHIYIDVELNDVYCSKIKRITYNRINPEGEKECKTVFLELYGLQQEYSLHAYGDYNLFTKEYTDLIIHVEVINTFLPSVTYEPIINPYELYITIQITVYEYYFGIDRDVPYLNTEKLRIQWLPVKQGLTIMMDGYGLPDEENKKNKLYGMLNVDLATHAITNLDRDIIYKLFGGDSGVK